MFRIRLGKSLSKDGRKIVPVIVAIAAVYLIFLAGYYTGRQEPFDSLKSRITNISNSKPSDVDFSLFWEAWNKLREKSVQSTDTNKLVQGAISGMMSSLGDPYTTYFVPEENKRFHEDISGEFGGIGVEIVQKNNLPTVVAPLPDTPAEKAGIKAGDVIIEVDGSKTSEIGFDETINKIRGAEGSKVKLTLLRENNDQPVDVELTRGIITVKSVERLQKNYSGKKIEYIKVRQFGDDTDSLFAQLAQDIQSNKPDGIIIDLRNNPGGYLETAVNLSSYFIDGVVVSEKGKDNKSKDYKAINNPKLTGYRFAVLVNKGSASASEIFAGAMQDRGVAKIIGETTFGKGSVQELVDLSDGSAVKVTVANWYTPNGRQIGKLGIRPDIEVSNEDNSPDDAQLNRAMEYIVNGK